VRRRCGVGTAELALEFESYRGPQIDGVENMLKERASLVYRWTLRNFLHRIAAQNPQVHHVDAPSMVLSLDCRCGAATLLTPCDPRLSPVNVHRIDQVINGRPYRIEVSNVGLDKWRAQIARVPGGSAATMPFYGSTPVEAANQLSRWLSLAHGQVRQQ